jgi:hypothetical protein
MSYRTVKLLVDDKTYQVDVDENARAQDIVQCLVTNLHLPRRRKYRLHLVDALKIEDGATLALVEVKPEDVFRAQE